MSESGGVHVPDYPWGSEVAGADTVPADGFLRTRAAARGQGRCGKTMPHLEGVAPSHCALEAGHRGWHRDDDGAEAGAGW